MKPVGQISGRKRLRNRNEKPEQAALLMKKSEVLDGPVKRKACGEGGPSHIPHGSGAFAGEQGTKRRGVPNPNHVRKREE